MLIVEDELVDYRVIKHHTVGEEPGCRVRATERSVTACDGDIRGEGGSWLDGDTVAGLREVDGELEGRRCGALTFDRLDIQLFLCERSTLTGSAEQ